MAPAQRDPVWSTAQTATARLCLSVKSRLRRARHPLGRSSDGPDGSWV